MPPPSSRLRRATTAVNTPSGRLITGALLAVGVGLLIGWAVFGGGDGKASTDATTPAVSATTGAGAVVRFGQYGITLRRPAGWSSTITKGVLNLAAPDSTISLAVSMAPGHPGVKGVRRSDREELARLFHAREVDRRRYAVGPLNTLVTEMVGRTGQGHPVRVLSMGVSSRWRTYSVQVFSAPHPPRARALELQGLVACFAFARPR